MKKLPIIIVSITVLALVGGFIFAKKLNNSGPTATPTPTPEEDIIETITSDSLHIKMEPRYDKKAVIITARGLKEKGFTNFEYELTYDAQNPEGEGIVSQGSFSPEPVKVTDEEFRREIILGTCSKNVCRYDKGVTNIKLTIRLKDESGKIKLWQKEFNLE